MTPIYLGPIISTMVGDTDLVPLTGVINYVFAFIILCYDIFTQANFDVKNCCLTSRYAAIVLSPFFLFLLFSMCNCAVTWCDKLLFCIYIVKRRSSARVCANFLRSS